MTQKRKLPKGKSDSKAVGAPELIALTVGLLTAVRLLVKSVDAQDSERLKRGVVAFSKFVDWTQMEYNKFSNQKNIQLIPYFLREKHQISPGALLTTLSKVQFVDKSASKKVLDVEANVIVLYLGIEMDDDYETIALKMLVENKVLYYYKREGLPWFVDNFTKHFKVLQKAKIDKT